MTIIKLREFTHWANNKLREKYGEKDKETQLLQHTVKVTKELGELCNEVLHYTNTQRKEKQEINE